jgi:hypothetical protein
VCILFKSSATEKHYFRMNSENSASPKHYPLFNEMDTIYFMVNLKLIYLIIYIYLISSNKM